LFKKRSVKYVVSASRRTDMLIGSQLERLIAALEGRLQSTPTLSAEKIHTLLISTKNYLPLLDVPALRAAAGRCDQVCVNLTITGFGATELEPRVPAADVLLKRLPELVDYIGNPQRVTWCFEPILSWRGLSNMSVETFRRIAKEMSGLGIQRVMALFFRDYEHSRITPNRIKPADKKRFIAEMDAIASELDLRLSVCKYGRFHRLKCVDVEYFADVHPEKDASVVEHYRSLPTPKGHCRDVIWDIGWYKPRCEHGCLYCYGLTR